MKKFTKLGLLTLLVATTIFSACKKEYDSIQTIDDAAIQSYITKNNLSNVMIQDPDKTGFYYQVLTPGTGDLFKNPDSVLYNITIKSLNNGTQYFQSPLNGNLGTYVGYTNNILTSYSFPAVRTAMLALKPGGTARVILPSYLAFGRNGYSTDPSNENIDLIVTTYPYRKQWQYDDFRIQNYLTTKGLTAIKDPKRTYYIVTQQGTGTEAITETSTVVYKYTGRLLDGTVFDSSTDGTFSSTFAGIALQGWKDITAKFTAGAKFRMFIPSDLAYKTTDQLTTSGAVSIPANSVLDFDIEIVSVTN